MIRSLKTLAIGAAALAAMAIAAPASAALKLVNHSHVPTGVWSIQNGPFTGEDAFGIGFNEAAGTLTGQDIFDFFVSGQSNILAIYANAGVGGVNDSLGTLLWTKTGGATGATISVPTGAFNDRFRRAFGVVDSSFSGNIVAAGTTTWGISDNNAVIPISVVPEPATWLMMISGFGLLAMRLKARRRQALGAAAA